MGEKDVGDSVGIVAVDVWVELMVAGVGGGSVVGDVGMVVSVVMNLVFCRCCR